MNASINESRLLPEKDKIKRFESVLYDFNEL
jgi:hypothetical protein